MLNKNESKKSFCWINNPNQKGAFLFTFDGTKIYNLFHDYPHALSLEEKALFDEANPYWVKFFKDRQ